MNEKQKRFCEEYIKDFNGSAAARRAGYSHKGDKERAAVLLNTPDVQEYLGELIQGIKERNELEVDQLIQELKRIAFSDMGEFYDENNKIRPVAEIDPEARAALETYQDDVSQLKYGEKRSRRVRLASKLDAIEKLMRYLGAYERDNKQKSEFDLTSKTTDELYRELQTIRKRRQKQSEEEE